MKTTFIYFLKDPENPMRGYVGKSNNPSNRFRSHNCRTKESSYRANWIKSLAAKGLQPILEIVDEIPAEHWQQLEVAYIEFFLEQGFILTNSNAGGAGGYNPSEETRAKMSVALQRRMLGNTIWLGRKHTPETLEKLSAAAQARWKVEIHLFGDKNPFYGKTHSVETRTKISAARLGRTASGETREKMRASQLLRWEKKKLQKEKIA